MLHKAPPDRVVLKYSAANYQGLDNCLIKPSTGVGVANGPVTRRDRLGGLLTYYYREAA